MKFFVPFFLFSALAEPATAALRGNSSMSSNIGPRVLQEKTVGVYLQADIQYGEGALTGPEQTDNIELPDGSIHTLVGGPPGLAKKFASGLSEIELPPGALMRADGKIDLKGNSPTNKGKGNNNGNGGGNGRGPFGRSLQQERNLSELRRGLAVVEGSKSVLAVRVIAADASTTSNVDEISDAVFGTFGDPVNLVSQYSDCSHGKLQFGATSNRSVTGSGAATNIANGVVTVTVPTLTSDGDQAMNQAIATELNAAFGVSSPSQLADHVMYCLPPNTMGGIAYAYINSWNSVYSDQWCNYVSAQLHEVGHNLNLAHSNEGNSAYEDQTGMMGYSYGQSDGPIMCFNNAKNWQIGWFPEAEITVDPVNNPSYVGPLKGQVNYQVGQAGQDPIIIKVEDPGSTTDYYIGFNHAAKHNSGTVEAPNQVTVQRYDPGSNGYGESWIESKMSANGSWSKVLSNGDEVFVNVGSVSTDTNTGAAQVSISFERTPTASPTVNTFCDSQPGTVRFMASVLTDNYPGETSWVLTNTCTGQTQMSGGSYTTANFEYTTEECVPMAEYTFTISDTYGDGICCGFGNGAYTAMFRSDVVASGGSYGSGETSAPFGSCGVVSPNPTPAPVTPPPTPAPVTPPPTSAPTNEPTPAPVTPPPTPAPVTPPPTPAPTNEPTPAPVTPEPTPAPVTSAPTPAPTNEPTPAPVTPDPTPAPVTTAPTPAPTNEPTPAPVTPEPTPAPVTTAPTAAPVTPAPTPAPTDEPTPAPVTPEPTPAPVTPPPTPAPINCTDDSAYEVVARNGRTKKCNWVAKNTSVRCPLVGTDGRDGFEGCPGSCVAACA